MIDAELKELLLTGGQELKLYALSGSGRGFYAQITGDCYQEGFDENSPVAALKAAINKYKTWAEEA